MWQGKGKTAIVGVGCSELSRRPQKPLGSLTLDACRAALDDAGVQAEQIDGLATYPEAPFHGAGTQFDLTEPADLYWHRLGSQLS